MCVVQAMNTGADERPALHSFAMCNVGDQPSALS
jgi:hypothetical protein